MYPIMPRIREHICQCLFRGHHARLLFSLGFQKVGIDFVCPRNIGEATNIRPVLGPSSSRIFQGALQSHAGSAIYAPPSYILNQFIIFNTGSLPINLGQVSVHGLPEI